MNIFSRVLNGMLTLSMHKINAFDAQYCNFILSSRHNFRQFHGIGVFHFFLWPKLHFSIWLKTLLRNNGNNDADFFPASSKFGMTSTCLVQYCNGFVSMLFTTWFRWQNPWNVDVKAPSLGNFFLWIWGIVTRTTTSSHIHSISTRKKKKGKTIWFPYSDIRLKHEKLLSGILLIESSNILVEEAEEEMSFELYKHVFQRKQHNSMVGNNFSNRNVFLWWEKR